MPAGGVSTSAFNLTDDVPLPAESPPCSGMWERLELVLRKLNAQAHYASTSSVLVRGHVAVSPNLASSGMAEQQSLSIRARGPSTGGAAAERGQHGGTLGLKVVPCRPRSLKVSKVCPGTLLRLRTPISLKVTKAYALQMWVTDVSLERRRVLTNIKFLVVSSADGPRGHRSRQYTLVSY